LLRQFFVTIPNELWDAARLLFLKARLEIQRGETKEALTTCRILLNIPKHLNDEPPLISQLVRISIGWMSFRCIQECLNEHDPPAEECSSLLLALDNLERRDLLVKSLECERCMGLDIFRTFGQGPPTVASRPFEALFRKIPLFKKDQIAYLRYMAGAISAAGKPFFEAKEDAEDLSAQIRKMPKSRLLSRVLAPGIQGVCEMQAVWEAQCRLARIGLALEIHKLQHGEYPGSLSALTPAVLPKTPKDPFTGGDILYKREGDGFVVYSVGADGQDGGGAVQGAKYKDVIWRCSRTRGSKKNPK